jgi:hypothetical protein
VSESIPGDPDRDEGALDDGPEAGDEPEPDGDDDEDAA